MAIRDIKKDQDPVLYKVAREVTKFDNRLAALIDDMAETMYAAEGVGLAGNQIGVLKRVAVIDIGEGLVELVNPEIIETSGLQGGMEGCLSFPGARGYVERPNKVTVRAFNRHGELREYHGEGLFARAILHETDHLDGNVYLRLVQETPEGYEDEYEED